MIEIRLLRPEELVAACARLPLSRLGQPHGEYFVAWEGNDPVGHAHLDWRVDPPELQDVYVAETSRRRGIAMALSAAAEAHVGARGHARIALTVSIRNLPAQSLYQKLGYVRTGAPPQLVRGMVQLRTGPLEVDDTLLRFEKRL